MESILQISPDKIAFTITSMCEYKNLPKKCKLVMINTKKIDDSWKKTKDYKKFIKKYTFFK